MPLKNKDFLIRALEPKDIPRLIELSEAHAWYEGAKYNRTGKEEKLQTHFFKEEGKIKCWVVEIEGFLEGYVVLSLEFSTWDADYYYHMDCLFITEKVRGNGIGSEILIKIKEFANAQKIEQIQWQTPIENIRAIDFYLNNGAISKDKKRFYMTSGS
ncbi:GNAT family N-acetyltransferase [Belliella pelovolcani]|uniref:Protein N-acetyltransferase, RimJ/RimL family n=1 Tax=Belliella pelovolcani TaxID=529505 RepID=A0A1N7PNS1_9BACT|nr:GNAT family N-acetyltransferase [Belliella pelovolcani]SIT12117.1 Protein N-acetyltransferase, RimJ/RimL family [Belliella pelovolcani]